MAIPDIRHVALIGAGNQGPKIAYRCAVSGLTASLYDIRPQALDTAFNLLGTWFEESTAAGRLTEAAAKEARTRIIRADSLAEGLKGAHLVIEAVPENLDLKRGVFKEIERSAPAEALLATNSSSLPSSKIADVLTRPERLFNVNFSNPQHHDDFLVELMRGPHTSDETLLAGEKFVRSLNMVPIVTLKEIMGFSFNRTWRAVKKEVLHLVDAGYVSPEDLDRAWMMDFGSPWGPFGLMDIIGLDTVRDIENQYYLDSGDESDKPPRLLEVMIAGGRLGVKSGRGFYSYPNPDYKNPAWLRKEGPWSHDLPARLAQRRNDDGK
ncbi:MAG: 3-hydroxyacyl-CoA dehydrogenase family protein [Thermodesulfobacteriota bacterium]